MPENITLSGSSQTQKHRRVGAHLHGAAGGESRGRKAGLVVRGWGGSMGEWGVLPKGLGVSICSEEKVLEFDGCDGNTPLRMSWHRTLTHG